MLFQTPLKKVNYHVGFSRQVEISKDIYVSIIEVINYKLFKKPLIIFIIISVNYLLNFEYFTQYFITSRSLFFFYFTDEILIYLIAKKFLPSILHTRKKGNTDFQYSKY